MITNDDIKRARELCAVAKPGAWRVDVVDDDWTMNDCRAVLNTNGKCVAAVRDAHTAAFIAAARDLIPALLDEVERLRARAADVDDAKRIWADDVKRKLQVLADGTEYEVGALVVRTDRERHERDGLGHAFDERVHLITSVLGRRSHLVECGPQQISRLHLKRAPEGSEVTCPHCAGWAMQMAKMHVDAEVYRRTREIQQERDRLRISIARACDIVAEMRDWIGSTQSDTSIAAVGAIGDEAEALREEIR